MRIVIAEDSVLLQAGLVRFLTEQGHEVVAAVGDAPSLLEAVADHRPALAVVDVRMPPTHTDDGLRAALEIRSSWPEVAILVLSQYVEEQYASSGATVLDPEVVAQILARSRRQDPLARLSPREREVLGLMAEGRSNSAIAAELVVSDGAVEKHVSNIFSKLDLPPAANDHRRVLAVLRWLES